MSHRFLVGAAICLTLAPAPGIVRAQQYTFTTLAHSDDVAIPPPGMTGGAFGLNSFDLPAVSGRNVAFIAYARPVFPGISYSRNVCLARRFSAPIMQIASAGWSSPSGGVFGDFPDTPSFSGNTVTFYGQTTIGAGIFASLNGSLSALAYSNNPHIGDTYWQGNVLESIGFGISNLATGNLSDAGIPFAAIYYYPGLQQVGYTGAGLFLKKGDAVQKIVLGTSSGSSPADPAPGTGGYFTGVFGRPVASKDGSVIAFRASYTGGMGIFKYAGGSLTSIAKIGDPAPGGGTFTGYVPDVAISGSGDNIAFLATTTTGGKGIYLFKKNGSLIRIADESIHVPNYGWTISDIGENRGCLCVNDSTVAFIASYIGQVYNPTLYVCDVNTPDSPAPLYGGQAGILAPFSIDDRGDVAFTTRDSGNVVLATPIVNVTNRLAATRSGLVYNRRTQLFVGTLTLKNVSIKDIYGPLKVTLTSLPGGVTLANAEGTDNGDPYLTIDFDTLPALTGSVTLPVQFSNPDGKRIDYAIKAVSY